jgi:hypothetical protein
MGLHQRGEVVVHPTRMPMSAKEFSVIRTNQQTKLRLRAGQQGEWNTEAWKLLKETLEKPKRGYSHIRVGRPLALADVRRAALQDQHTEANEDADDTDDSSVDTDDSSDDQAGSDDQSGGSENQDAENEGGTDGSDESHKDEEEDDTVEVNWKTLYEEARGSLVDCQDVMYTTEVAFKQAEESEREARSKCRDLEQQLVQETTAHRHLADKVEMLTRSLAAMQEENEALKAALAAATRKDTAGVGENSVPPAPRQDEPVEAKNNNTDNGDVAVDVVSDTCVLSDDVVVKQLKRHNSESSDRPTRKNRKTTL